MLAIHDVHDTIDGTSIVVNVTHCRATGEEDDGVEVVCDGREGILCG